MDNIRKCERKRKSVDLPEDVMKVLSIQAIIEGMPAKIFMEKILIEAAKRYEKTAIFAQYSTDK